jgi:superfamily II DNA or RNA helicase
MQLRPYQEEFATNIAKRLSEGFKRIVGQLATGGGKTITFSAITNRYITRSKKSVLIIVHREELLEQTKRTLYRSYGIIAEVVGKQMQKADVYVSMVETLNNKLKNNPNYFVDVGLVIADEAHIANFHKIFPYFPTAYIVGFTATPISASKRKPLKGQFEDIICGIDIPELIQMGALVKNITINCKNDIKRTGIAIKNGEFDASAMANEYKKAKPIENTLHAYSEYAIGTKTLIFNCNIEHSKAVCERFQREGLPCKHLDAGNDDRKEILQWFKETPDAILCNIGILTTGFDEPSIQTIIVNKSTLSIPLWLQMCGRGSRPFNNKEYFKIIDLGSNAINLGDWDDKRDWKYIFYNPAKAGDGVAPVKECPKCHCINYASVKECKDCGYTFPVIEPIEMPVEFQIFSQNIDVQKIIRENEHRKEYYTFFKIPNDLAREAKRNIKELNDDLVNDILKHTHTKCREWCHQKDKKYNQWHKDLAQETLYTSLQNYFKKWQPKQSA